MSDTTNVDELKEGNMNETAALTLTLASAEKHGFNNPVRLGKFYVDVLNTIETVRSEKQAAGTEEEKKEESPTKGPSWRMKHSVPLLRDDIRNGKAVCLKDVSELRSGDLFLRKGNFSGKEYVHKVISVTRLEIVSEMISVR